MRRQLVMMTLAITSIVVIAFVLPLAFMVRTISADRATSQATADAQNVAQIIAGNRAGAAALVAQTQTSVAGTISVFYADGTVVGDTSHPPANDSLVLARRGRSFSRSAGGRVDVFMPVLESAGLTAVVRVSVPRHELDRGVHAAWLSLAGLAVVLLLLAGLVADRMARSVTNPMNMLTKITRRLAAGDLEARSQVSGSPEVVEVSRALDMLAVRIGDLLQAEREQAADLSHSLRTPLTALRLDAELLRDPVEAQRIMAAVDDLESAVTNVIADTRRERQPSGATGVDLADVLRERIAFWEVLARAQGRALVLHLDPDPLLVRASRRDLQQLVDVLIDNVLRHTPSGRQARVSISRPSGGGACLVVEDAGPGFALAAPVSNGSGRGMEIARRIARDSGGSLSTGHSDLGGARVEVVLGPV